MAVVPMEKINICANKKNRKQILEELQRLGVIELVDIKNEEPIFGKENRKDNVLEILKHQQNTKTALELLDEYVSTPKKLTSMLEGKKEISVSEYNSFQEKYDSTYEVVQRIIKLAKAMEENRSESSKITLQMEALTPWLSLDVPLNLTGTKTTTLWIGSLPGVWDKEGIEQLFEDIPWLETSIISVLREQTCFIILCRKKDSNEVFERLRMNGFAKPAISGGIIPSELYKEYEEKVNNINKEIQYAKEEIISFADYRETLQFLYDYDGMRAEKYEAMELLLQSKHLFFLSGYIPKTEVEEVKQRLDQLAEVAITFEEPKEDEDVPVLLRNNQFAEPLEMITEGFSPPGKGEADPTSIMSLFYYILFGIMFSDAGYGFVLALVCTILLKKYKNMEKSIKNSIRMFQYCGISTVFWGVIFSSYFGDAVDAISLTFFNVHKTIPPLWFSPTEYPMRMLVFSMAVGILHLYTGLGMKMIQCLKKRQFLDALYDCVFWFVLLTSSVIILLSMQMFVDIIGISFKFSSDVGNIAAILAVVSAIGIILTGGRESKNWFKRILKGLYGLYGITGYLSDVLSYSRLLALGLATGVIGTVINKMGAMAGNGVVKIIIFVTVFLVGHILNFGINILGAYVHTNRLQYVEFFGKFYEGGGRKFRPFQGITKYYRIKEK